MKNIILTSFFAVILVALTSFTKHTSERFIGVFGVSENDPSEIELVLNEDQTYTYKDLSNPNNPINVFGKWIFKKDHFILLNKGSNASFHSKWKISNDGTVAKSRKGLSFYTLRKK